MFSHFTTFCMKGLSDSAPGELITLKKLDNLLSHFWERWRKEYLVNLRESHKTAKPATTKGEHPMVQIGDVVVMEEGNMPRSSWRLGKVEGLIKGHDNQVRGAHVKVAKTNAVVQRPVSRLYKIEGKEDKVNSNILNKGNLNTNSDHSANISNRPKREARNNWGIKTQIVNARFTAHSRITAPLE